MYSSTSSIGSYCSPTLAYTIPLTLNLHNLYFEPRARARRNTRVPWPMTRAPPPWIRTPLCGDVEPAHHSMPWGLLNIGSLTSTTESCITDYGERQVEIELCTAPAVFVGIGRMTLNMCCCHKIAARRTTVWGDAAAASDGGCQSFTCTPAARRWASLNAAAPVALLGSSMRALFSAAAAS